MNLGSRDVFPHGQAILVHPALLAGIIGVTETAVVRDGDLLGRDSAPNGDAARHLVWRRDELGDRFLGGVVLHTGPATFALGDRITAAPISPLWACVARR